MNWTVLGRIADVLAILSFIISIGIFKKIYSRSIMQKETYIEERTNLLNHLSALQQNIWIDGIVSTKLQDQLETKIFEYRIKYWMISSLLCHIHIHKALKILNKEINRQSNAELHHHVNYLIARLSKKE